MNYVLHGLKFADRPSPKTMFEWLRHQLKGLHILRQIPDKVRESNQRSQKRYFEWIWTQIADELWERRHDMNYENVVKGLRGSPPHQLASPATGGEQSTKTPKTKGPKKAATAQPAVSGPWRQHSLSRWRFLARYMQPGNVSTVKSAGIIMWGEPGSEAARISFAEHQKSKGQGGETSKRAGKQR